MVFHRSLIKFRETNEKITLVETLRGSEVSVVSVPHHKEESEFITLDTK